MQAHIFAEESNTTADSVDMSVKEYYEGLFSIVSGLDNDLSELTETRLHILSEEYGVVEAEEKIALCSGSKFDTGNSESWATCSTSTSAPNSPTAAIFTTSTLDPHITSNLDTCLKDSGD